MDLNKTSYYERYKNELLNLIIPFWEKHCIDDKYGGYFTYLDQDGTVYDTDKYMWMQWRIVYMFAVLSMEDFAREKRERWLSIAEKGYEFLIKHGRDQSGNFYFALDRQGKPIIAPYNIFSEAFAVMGLSSLYKATKDEQYKVDALKSMQNYIKRMKNPKGKWDKRRGLYAKARLSHGIYMIFANLGEIIEDYLEISDYIPDVENAIDLILNKFWDNGHGVLLESINEDYSFDRNGCDGRLVNPGHCLESMWFILQYGECHKRQDYISKACYIIKSMLKFGWDEVNGGIFYFMDVLGKPPVELSWDMKLWWVHDEALIASLYAYRMTR
ncbi:MAG: AGE family epimerase/isomerase, partial [Promethearchaeota archaeon]